MPEEVDKQDIDMLLWIALSEDNTNQNQEVDISVYGL